MTSLLHAYHCQSDERPSLGSFDPNTCDREIGDRTVSIRIPPCGDPETVSERQLTALARMELNHLPA